MGLLSPDGYRDFDTVTGAPGLAAGQVVSGSSYADYVVWSSGGGSSSSKSSKSDDDYSDVGTSKKVTTSSGVQTVTGAISQATGGLNLGTIIIGFLVIVGVKMLFGIFK